MGGAELEVERLGTVARFQREDVSHGGGGGWRLAPSGGCRFGWLGRRVVLFGERGEFALPCARAVRAVRAKNGSRASMVTAEKPGWLSLGGGKPFAVCCVGLLRCEKGGIAAALLGAVAETAGIRSGGEGGD